MNSKFHTDRKVFSYDEIQVDPGISTTILFVHSQYSDHVLNSLAESLKEKQYVVKSSLKNKTILSAQILYNGREVGTVDSHYVWLVANTTLHLDKDIDEILKSNFSYFRKQVYRVPHTDKEKILSDKMSVRTISGIIAPLDDTVPFSIFLLYEDRTLIGKALLSYFNSEMDEYDPTIVSMQVLKERQGESGVFMKQIEGELKRCGFVKLWIKEVQNEDFWAKAGYQFEDGQGVKYLK